MRGKILLVLGVLVALVVGFYLGIGWQESAPVPEKVVYHTTSATENEVKDLLTEEQKKDFEATGFRTDSFNPIETKIQKGELR